jgi:hypothetical protein
VSLRSSTIYVEPKTVRRLILVTKIYPERTIDSGGSALREKTADERADTLLNEAINVKYPKVMELEKLLTKTEKDFLKENQTNKQ